MSRLIIENASYVVTVDATDTVLRDTTITIDDGIITAITPRRRRGTRRSRGTGRSRGTRRRRRRVRRAGRWLGLAGAGASASERARMDCGRPPNPAQPEAPTSPSSTRAASS
jgi:hypothetical protein